jgi:hypothetical protein
VSAGGGRSHRKHVTKVTRLPDDPLALRASIGGKPDIGYYLTYRGDPKEVLSMLREVLDRAELELGK